MIKSYDDMKRKKHVLILLMLKTVVLLNRFVENRDFFFLDFLMKIKFSIYFIL